MITDSRIFFFSSPTSASSFLLLSDTRAMLLTCIPPPFLTRLLSFTLFFLFSWGFSDASSRANRQISHQVTDENCRPVRSTCPRLVSEDWKVQLGSEVDRGEEGR